MIPFIKSIFNMINDHKRILGILLIFFGIFLFAQKTLNNNPNVDKNSPFYVNSIYMSDGRIYTNYLDDDTKHMYDFIMDRIKRGKRVTQMTPAEYGCPDYRSCFSLMSSATNAIWIDHPELLSFASFDISYKYDTNILTFRIRRSFKLPGMDKIGEMIINYQIEKLVKDTEGYTDKERIKYVYNWIGNHMKYDTIFTSDNKNQTIYAAFIQRNAVCAGFAKTAQVIFQRMGIKSYLVDGYTTGPHMWNIIEVDGKNYFFDSTVAACIKEDHYMYYDGLKQSNFEDYRVSNKSWYPIIEKNELFGKEELKIEN